MTQDVHSLTPNFDRINPRNCVNAKLRRLHRMVEGVYQSQLRVFGLKGSMLSILFIIGKQELVNQKFIAEILLLDQSTMSRDIKKLESKGWIQKRVSSTDSRTSELSLTNDGIILLEEIAPVWEGLHQKVESVLGQFNIRQIDVLTEAFKNEFKSDTK